MPLSPVFVRRSLRDTNNIAKVTVRAATRVSYKIRARYIESLRSGGKNKFKVKPYVLEQLRGIYVMSAMAAHLSGYRRLFLIRRQTPALMRKLMEQEAQRDPLTLSFDNPQLLLSELSDALSVLTKRTFLDINELQEKYDTRALKVLNDTSEAIEEQLDETFKRLIKEGSTVNNAVKELGKQFDELGLSPKKPYQLETIFRTQLQLSFNAGRYQAEQHPDIQEILWGYKYVSVGDDRVRPEHEAIDGVTLPKDDAFWQRFYPPNGWNCRCQVIPLFEEREIQKPPELDDNGNPIAPDKDFNFNPGIAFSAPATEPPATEPKQDLESIAKSLVSSGTVDKPELEGLTDSEAVAVNEALAKSLTVGGHDLKLRQIGFPGTIKFALKDGGAGYTNGYIGVSESHLKTLREWPQKREAFLKETGGKVSYLWQQAETAEHALAITVAHEVGHHVENTLLLDTGKAGRVVGTIPENESEIVSGYATTHKVELFAEVHAAMSLGMEYFVPKHIQDWYIEAIKTQDADPLKVFIK